MGDVAPINFGGTEVYTAMQTDLLNKEIYNTTISSNDPNQKNDSVCLPLITKIKRVKNISNG